MHIQYVIVTPLGNKNAIDEFIPVGIVTEIGHVDSH